jgi:hypothetical protein
MENLSDKNISFIPYEIANNIAVPKGANSSLINNGPAYGSLINKLHLIKLSNLNPDDSKAYSGENKSKFEPKTFSDLCKMSANGAQQYDAEDFLYCKKLDFPINRLITLRRFPLPCTDNIYNSFNQSQPDIARMVTYFDQDVNKMEDILSFSYGMKWKLLTAEMEQASTIGDQSGFSGLSKKVMGYIDPVMAQNKLKGQNALDYDPKHDQNKVYGPVDSITETNIRDVGLEFTKDFDLQFDYELRSINGRTPEFAFKDLIANILAVTYNNAKFWPGSRYWVGERPSQFLNHMQYMNPDNMDEFLSGAFKDLKATLGGFAKKGSAINQLKNLMSNGLAMALGKILDNVGRPSILVMNSLLSGEPTGFWHVTIGNPDNPIMCIGNLICTGVDVKFPTDSLSYGDFPTKLQVNVKLKPGQPKDKAGIETMFNHGKSRIYYNPKSIKVSNNNSQISKRARSFNGFTEQAIDETIKGVFDFVADKVAVVTESGVSNFSGQGPLLDNSQENVFGPSNNYQTARSFGSVLG